MEHGRVLLLVVLLVLAVWWVSGQWTSDGEPGTLARVQAALAGGAPQADAIIARIEKQQAINLGK